MRALEGGRDDLRWVCVRGIRPHVWCVLAGTIPVARRPPWAVLRTNAGYFLSRNRVPVCRLRAPIVQNPGTASSYGQNPIWIELNPYEHALHVKRVCVAFSGHMTQDTDE